MANVVFSGNTKEIWVLPSVTEINVKLDLYSEWKRWVDSSTSNMGWLPAFRTVGGDPTAAGQYSPQYFFLLNGWKIVVDGTTNPNVDFALNLYVDGGGDPFIKLNGATISNLRSDVAVVESTIANLLDYAGSVIYDEIEGFSGTTWPVGTRAQPVNNCTDAKILMDTYHCDEVIVRSPVMNLTEDFPSTNFVSRGSLAWLNVNGHNVNGSVFKEMLVYGDFVNSQVVMFDCLAYQCYNVHGIFNNCQLGGITNLSSVSSSTFSHCWVGVPNSFSPHVIDMGASRSTQASFMGLNGDVLVKNMDNASDKLKLYMDGGEVIFHSSCVAGFVEIEGIGIVEGLSNIGPSMTLETAALWNPETESAKLSEMLGLGQSNFTMTNQTYTSSGSLETCVIKTFPTAADLQLDTNPIAIYDVDATYDGNGLLNSYKVTKR